MVVAFVAGGVAAAQDGPVIIVPDGAERFGTPEFLRDWLRERPDGLALRLRDSTVAQAPCGAASIPTPFSPGGAGPIPGMELRGPAPAPMPNLCEGGAVARAVPAPPARRFLDPAPSPLLRPFGRPRFLFRAPVVPPAAPPPDER